jgi:hypothetical protein
LTRERLFAHRLVTRIETAAVPVNPIARRVVRGMTRTRRVIKKNGFSGATALASLMNSIALSVMSSVK